MIEKKKIVRRIVRYMSLIHSSPSEIIIKFQDQEKEISSLNNEQLLSLEKEIALEINRRGLVNNKKKKFRSDHYVNKWDVWVKNTENRQINWSWGKRKKGWQLALTVRDENGYIEVFSRWGKTKKITQRILAQNAWMAFVEPPEDENENEPCFEEEEFYEVYYDFIVSDEDDDE